jgi:hypothetical protein
MNFYVIQYSPFAKVRVSSPWFMSHDPFAKIPHKFRETRTLAEATRTLAGGEG